MSFLGNLLWFILCGFWQGLSWCITGVLWCITIIGIPVGLQCFKFAKLSFFPFGKEIVYNGGAGSCLLNILWLIFGGLQIALVSAVNGILLCITVIGIPFGIQCFKQAKLALMPFGATVVNNNNEFIAVVRHPIGRLDEVAHAIVFLAENGFVTGASLLVDGGYTAQ